MRSDHLSKHKKTHAKKGVDVSPEVLMVPESLEMEEEHGEEEGEQPLPERMVVSVKPEGGLNMAALDNTHHYVIQTNRDYEEMDEDAEEEN